MKELFDFAFSGVNIIPTLLFLFVMIYWLIVIVGIVDIDTFDIDVDADLNVDGFSSVLLFFNIGDMPFMIFLTFFTIPFWMVTLAVNDFLGIESFFPGLIVLIPSFIGCLFVAKFLTIPVALFFKKAKSHHEGVENIVGSICQAKLQITSDKISQAEIKVNGSSVLINAKTKPGLVIEKGQQALVIEHQKDLNFFIVEPY